MVDSDLRSIVPEWIELLAGPILKGGYDFVAPLYARHKYDGTITNTVTYPVTRALYGHRIRQPIGGDFGVSGDLIRHYLEPRTAGRPDVSRFGIDIWMTTTALTGGFAVCQTRLGAKIHDPKDPGSDLGPMFRQVVGTLLTMARDNADALAARSPAATTSRPTASSGYVEPAPLEVNTLRLLAQFHAGSLTLADTWAQVASRPENCERVLALAAEAGTLAEAAAHGWASSRESGEGTGRRGRCRRRTSCPTPSPASTSRTTCGPASSTTCWSRRASATSTWSGSWRRSCRSTSAASAASSSRTGASPRSRPRSTSSARPASSSCCKPYLVERWHGRRRRRRPPRPRSAEPASTAR